MLRLRSLKGCWKANSYLDSCTLEAVEGGTKVLESRFSDSTSVPSSTPRLTNSCTSCMYKGDNFQEMNMKFALKFEVSIGTGKRVPGRLRKFETIASMNTCDW